MTPSPIAIYQKAKIAFVDTVEIVESMLVNIDQARDALRNWRKTMVANCEGGFPPEVALKQDARGTLDVRRWPTGQQIADALIAYHKAWQELEHAYKQIPSSEREVVSRPNYLERRS